jgi:streptogramin lyase
MGDDGAVWFGEETPYVGRFKDGVLTSVRINLSKPNSQPAVTWPWLTATSSGIYTAVVIDSGTIPREEDDLVRISYSRAVSFTKGSAVGVPASWVGAIVPGGSAVYATGAYNSYNGPCATACVFLISDSGKSKYLTNSYEIPQAAAYLNGFIYVAAQASYPWDPTIGERFYKFNATTFAVQLIATLPSPANVVGMTAGPDGALWYTDYGRDAIGRLSTAGSVREYRLPTANAQPNGITVSGGRIWFSETNSNKVGWITTTGVIKEYPIPATNSSPGEMANGPVGSRTIWFVQSGVDEIGRITY